MARSSNFKRGGVTFPIFYVRPKKRLTTFVLVFSILQEAFQQQTQRNLRREQRASWKRPCKVVQFERFAPTAKSTMNTPSRCNATMVLILTALAASTQAFTCAAVRNTIGFGESSSYRATTLLRSSTSTTSLGSRSMSRTGRCGSLSMSEMAEDYPSDTGDDRFGTGGESRFSDVLGFLLLAVESDKKVGSARFSRITCCEKA